MAVHLRARSHSVYGFSQEVSPREAMTLTTQTIGKTVFLGENLRKEGGRFV